MRIMLLIMLLPSMANAELIISEIMTNEPGDTVQLEWIEVYNGSDTLISLELYRLIVDFDSISLPPFEIEAHSYALLARQLVADSGSPSFESRWGNSSGYWGDSPQESYDAIDLDFSLLNNSGSAALARVDNSYQDCYEWSTSGQDGVSIERNSVDPPDNNWHESTAEAGSTPGAANSPPGQPANEVISISVEPQMTRSGSGEYFSISISSPGGCRALIEVLDDTGRRVRTILNSRIAANTRAEWYGLNGNNERLAPGIYFIYAAISGCSDVTKTIPVVIAP